MIVLIFFIGKIGIITTNTDNGSWCSDYEKENLVLKEEYQNIQSPKPSKANGSSPIGRLI
jgi:hypothetical protein